MNKIAISQFNELLENTFYELQGQLFNPFDDQADFDKFCYILSLEQYNCLICQDEFDDKTGELIPGEPFAKIAPK